MESLTGLQPGGRCESRAALRLVGRRRRREAPGCGHGLSGEYGVAAYMSPRGKALVIPFHNVAKAARPRRVPSVRPTPIRKLRATHRVRGPPE